MKKIKWLIGAFMIIICFVMNSEMYQNYILDFTNDFYYLDIESYEDRDKLVKVLTEASNRFKAFVFSVERNDISPQRCEADIYADEEAYKFISENYNIKIGKYNSFFSGQTDVAVHSFSEVSDHPGIIRFYFSADSDQMEQIFYSINKSFDTSYIHKEGATGFVWIMNSVWIIAFLFLLMLTWFSIQFDKKKNFVRISLGASKLYTSAKSMLLDFLVFSVEFVVAYLILRNNIYIDYKFKNTILLFILFLISVGLINLTLLKYRYKEILYGANLNDSLLSNCYLMKAVTLILAIASLSINIPLIAENTEKLEYYKAVSEFSDYSFVNFTPDETAFEDDEEIDPYEQISRRFFFDKYEKDSVKFSSAVNSFDYKDDEKNIIILNDSRFIFSEEIKNKINPNTDFTVFIPPYFSEFGITKEDCVEYTELFFGINSKDVTFDFVSYKTDCNVLFLDNNLNNELRSGFSSDDNTVFVFSNLSGQKFGKIADINLSEPMGSIMYNNDFGDNNEILKKYNLWDFTAQQASERLSEGKETSERILLINTVISSFMLGLEVAIILTIIKLEYVVNAKVLAIKKILGHSVLAKNKGIFLLNLFAAFIGVITNVILALMYKITVWYMPVIIGAFLVIVEFLIMIKYIAKTECTNVSKILKGGSL